MFSNLSDEELERRLAELEAQEQAPVISEPEHTVGERVGQFGRGLVGGTTGTLDLLNKIVPGNQVVRAMTEDYSTLPEERVESNLAPEAKAYYEKLTGIGAPSKADKVGQFAETMGEFGVPIPGSGYVKAAKMGAKAFLPLLKREAAHSAGAAAATTFTPNIAEEGTLGHMFENMGKAFLGGKLGNKIASKATTDTLKQLSPSKVISKGLSLGAYPTKESREAIQLAKKHGIELPLNVGMRSKPLNFLQNNYLKTMFVSNAYVESMKNADKSMVEAVKNKINTFNYELPPHEISTEYKNLLRSEEMAAEKEASKLYEKASQYLKPTDKVVPKNTIDMIESMRELVNRDIQSPATKRVVKIISDLGESWGIKPPKGLDKDPKLANLLLDSIKKRPPSISIDRLNGVRKELGTITQHDPDIKGVESYLNGLKSSITKDIQSSSNKEFVNAWEDANKVFKKNVADKFRTDFANSITKGEMPTEAYNLMTNPANIKELERIAGETPAGIEIFNKLKEAKAREIFSRALKDDSLGTANFSNLFQNPKNQQGLKLLLGNESYKEMKELSKIAKEFQSSQRDLLNTSSTALAHADIGRIHGLAALFGMGTGGPVGAVAAIATPHFLSRVMANPKIIQKARSYAIARTQGREKYADRLLNQLMHMTENDYDLAVKSAMQSIPQEETE